MCLVATVLDSAAVGSSLSNWTHCPPQTIPIPLFPTLNIITRHLILTWGKKNLIIPDFSLFLTAHPHLHGTQIVSTLPQKFTKSSLFTGSLFFYRPFWFLAWATAELLKQCHWGFPTPNFLLHYCWLRTNLIVPFPPSLKFLLVPTQFIVIPLAFSTDLGHMYLVFDE